MTRLAVSVEGQTEEAFVKKVLAKALRSRGVEPCPVLLGRARNARQGGGNVSVPGLVEDMVALRHNFDAVTSLVDFYGFRDRGDHTVEDLESRLLEEIQRRLPHASRVVPYVQRHEFEGLLFSDAEAFRVIGASGQIIEALRNIRLGFGTPEDINDSPVTAPSKRLGHLVPQYRKVLHGPMVAERVGLDSIRKECPRFDKWLSKLEGL